MLEKYTKLRDEAKENTAEHEAYFDICVALEKVPADWLKARTRASIHRIQLLLQQERAKYCYQVEDTPQIDYYKRQLEIYQQFLQEGD